MTRHSQDIPEEALNAAVAAMVKAQRERLRDALHTAPMDHMEIERFFLDLATESDRAVGIVVYEYLDGLLRQSMETALSAEIDGGTKGLFAPFAPLATANGRLKLAGALRWVSPGLYLCLERLRKVRNKFAHTPFLKSLDDPRVAPLLAAIPSLETEPFKFLAADWAPRPDPSTRLTVIARGAILGANIVTQVGTAPTAIAMGLHPSTALGPGLKDNAPDWVYQTIETGLRTAVQLLLVRVADAEGLGGT